jgi:hypothetical protein
MDKFSFFNRRSSEKKYNLYFGNMGGLANVKQRMKDALKLYGLRNFEIDRFNNVRMFVTYFDNNEGFSDQPEFISHFRNNCTFIYDPSGVTGWIRSYSFQGIQSPFTFVSFSDSIRLDRYSFPYSNLSLFVIPKGTILGSNPTLDNVFNGNNNPSNANFIFNDFLQTNNAGSPDGDVEYVENRGGNVEYYVEQNAPALISNLSYADNNSSTLLSYTVDSETSYLVLWMGGFVHKIVKTADWDGLIDTEINNTYDLQIQTADKYFNLSGKVMLTINT